MRFGKTEIHTLKLLFKSAKGLNQATLFRRLQCPFANYIKAIHKLENLELITVNDYQIKLTKSGKDLFLSKYESSLVRTKKEWRQSPLKFSASQLSTNELYIPSLNRLDMKGLSKISKHVPATPNITDNEKGNSG